MFDLLFARNLATTLIILTVFILGLDKLYRQDQNPGKLQRVQHIEQALRVGFALKATQFR
ncbi:MULTISPECIES: hypothetical protein [Moorena]|uniref:Uncharacterized protein n=1 Tax=Moorena producens (strain JHB) TaxID=1454205 RepID=A0A1D9FY51_MOOP1|nr:MULTISPECIES: hypothetical protein [Moorena]NEQ18274.1 hypothetical protein [Moorena sp. SIO3E2]NES85303.1 hypothetical protein [Moorena sp. SIO2B7]AOY80204.1 hypothetical protein BJP36_10000 [Moorena producens JHB]NEP37627.1 hypothetical protein [Moorena sp. SIO3B2]NEQ12147.1 hypothetical protein [Moorena sp. SIO4E2]